MLPQHSRNLALELVRVTASAALAAARFMDRGDGHIVDQAAVDAMRIALQSVQADGKDCDWRRREGQHPNALLRGVCRHWSPSAARFRCRSD